MVQSTHGSTASLATATRWRCTSCSARCVHRREVLLPHLCQTDARIQDLPPYTELQRAAKFVENFPVPSHLKFPYGDLDRITEPVLPDDLSMPSDERVAQDIVWVEAQHASGESWIPCCNSHRLPIYSHRTDPIWHRTGPMPTASY